MGVLPRAEFPSGNIALGLGWPGASVFSGPRGGVAGQAALATPLCVRFLCEDEPGVRREGRAGPGASMWTLGLGCKLLWTWI